MDLGDTDGRRRVQNGCNGFFQRIRLLRWTPNFFDLHRLRRPSPFGAVFSVPKYQLGFVDREKASIEGVVQYCIHSRRFERHPLAT